MSLSQTPKAIAFYLPQFHPIPENDEWWGPGFSEWRNVVRARPSYTGHYQPQIPAELGFYDLRMPEIREAQAALARQHGIAAFCYYHYWFGGRRVLERPFNEVLASGSPDLPFCLCWANEPWTRNWDGGTRDILIPQRYSEEDDRAHIRWLIEAFRDERYLRSYGRPVFTVYNAGALPDALRTTTAWREECVRAGIGQPYLIKFNTFGDERDPAEWGFDAAAEFLPHGLREMAAAVGLGPLADTRNLDNVLWQYDDVVKAQLFRPMPRWTRYQCVFPGWDNTPRKPRGHAHIVLNSTPEAYGQWLRGAYRKAASADHEFVFLNAWNEWAESAHLEPDLRHGRAYLEATANVVGANPTQARSAAAKPVPRLEADAVPDEEVTVDYHKLYFEHRASMAGEIERLMRQIQELEDRLAESGTMSAAPAEVASGAELDSGAEPEAELASRSAGKSSPGALHVPVGRRLLRSADLLRREWRRL